MIVIDKILGQAARLKRGNKLALFIFATWFMTVNAPLSFAQQESMRLASASANQLVGNRNTENGNSPPAVAQTQEHGLSQKAVEIARPLGFPITNSMVVSWLVALGLIIFARVATRDMKGVPGGAQNLLEWLVGGLYDFLEKIIGPRLLKRTFWFFATVFIFILSRIGSDSSPGLAPSGGDIRPPTVSSSINRCSAERMPIST